METNYNNLSTNFQELDSILNKAKQEVESPEDLNQNKNLEERLTFINETLISLGRALNNCPLKNFETSPFDEERTFKKESGESLLDTVKYNSQSVFRKFESLQMKNRNEYDVCQKWFDFMREADQYIEDVTPKDTKEDSDEEDDFSRL